MVIPLDAARMTLYSFLIKKPSFKKRQTTMPHKKFPLVTSSAASRDDMLCCPENSDIVIEYIMQVHIRTWTGRTSHAHKNILYNLSQQNLRRSPRYAATNPVNLLKPQRQRMGYVVTVTAPIRKFTNTPICARHR